MGRDAWLHRGLRRDGHSPSQFGAWQAFLTRQCARTAIDGTVTTVMPFGAFVEVFEMPYHEIAEVVGKTPAAVRQIAHRAREHVAARRPRMQVDRAQQQAAVEKFMAAISTGDVQGLVAVLAPDVVLIADGGGLVAAARKPITGVEKVVAFLARAVKIPDFAATTAWLNGMPGARIDIGGAATAVSLVVEDGRITRIYAIRNPHKLGWLEKVAELRR